MAMLNNQMVNRHNKVYGTAAQAFFRLWAALAEDETRKYWFIFFNEYLGFPKMVIPKPPFQFQY